jgi:hypothetical protein
MVWPVVVQIVKVEEAQASANGAESPEAPETSHPPFSLFRSNNIKMGLFFIYMSIEK